VVQVGIRSRQLAEVRDGLAEGEQVAIPRAPEPRTAPRRGFF
jgi:hypothetical protein